MAKSAKAKKEKKKDFQKVKLKVGKTKAKAANFTDTSFKARSISVLQQSLTANAPTSSAQFMHHLGLLNHRSENQRRESLSYLTNVLRASSDANVPPPAPVSTVLIKVQPLLLDSSTAVRNQMLKLLQELDSDNVVSHVDKLLLFVRAGMTNLSTGVRASAVDVLEWLLNVAPVEVVSVVGGWIRTLDVFLILLQWQTFADGSNNESAATMKTGDAVKGWAPTTTATAGKSSEQIALISSAINVLAQFLEIGLHDTQDLEAETAKMGQLCFPLAHTWYHCISRSNNPFGYLNLFGAAQDMDDVAVDSAEERRRVYGQRFASHIIRGLEVAKREGGMIGRSTAEAERVLKRVWSDHGQHSI